MGIEDEELATWVMETDVEPWGGAVGMGDVSCHSHILDLLLWCGWHKVCWCYEEWG